MKKIIFFSFFILYQTFFYGSIINFDLVPEEDFNANVREVLSRQSTRGQPQEQIFVVKIKDSNDFWNFVKVTGVQPEVIATKSDFYTTSCYHSSQDFFSNGDSVVFCDQGRDVHTFYTNFFCLMGQYAYEFGPKETIFQPQREIDRRNHEKRKILIRNSALGIAAVALIADVAGKQIISRSFLSLVKSPA